MSVAEEKKTRRQTHHAVSEEETRATTGSDGVDGQLRRHDLSSRTKEGVSHLRPREGGARVTNRDAGSGRFKDGLRHEASTRISPVSRQRTKEAR